MKNSEISRGGIVGVIPARYGSSRFEGKVLADIAGKPMIQWVYERASQSKMLDALFVAVDDPRVQSVVEGFGGKAIRTEAHHKSGTDRIAEVVEKMMADIIVNIQGDQPLIDPNMIDEAVQPMIDNPEIKMSTLKREIEEDEFGDPGVVKVVVDENDFALYFRGRSFLIRFTMKICELTNMLDYMFIVKIFFWKYLKCRKDIWKKLNRWSSFEFWKKDIKSWLSKRKWIKQPV